MKGNKKKINLYSKQKEKKFLSKWKGEKKKYLKSKKISFQNERKQKKNINLYSKQKEKNFLSKRKGEKKQNKIIFKTKGKKYSLGKKFPFKTI